MSAITREMLDYFQSDFSQNPKNTVAMNAVMKSGPMASALNQQEERDNPMLFSIEIETGKITNQKASGRCWLFAALNSMRFQVMKKLNLETFELSQNYQMFYDKLEKANYFMDCIIRSADEDVSSRLVSHLLMAPEGDGGQWDMYCAIADKYGCVPKYAMPETYSSSSTREMCMLLTQKLREDAIILRSAVARGKKTDPLKKELLNEIYRILVICLGEPPKTFDFEYRDKDKNFHRHANMTPKEFFEFQLTNTGLIKDIESCFPVGRKVESVEIAGDSATLKMESVHDKNVSDKIPMRMENGRWRIVFFPPGDIKR